MRTCGSGGCCLGRSWLASTSNFGSKTQPMSAVLKQLSIDGIPIVRLESQFLRADVAPGIGGRTVSLVDKATGHEFLWRNQNLRLQLLPAGSEYDPNFY